MKYFQKLVDELYTWKWTLLFILMFIFGWGQRRHLIDSAIHLQAQLNQWDIIIGLSGNPYALLYLVLPFILLLSCLNIRDRWSFIDLVRVRSWRRWVLHSVKTFQPAVAVTTVMLLITSILLTAGIPYEATWSSYSAAPISSYNVLSAVSWESGMSPYAVIILQMLLIYLYLLTVHAIITAFYLYFPNMVYLGVVGFFMLIYALVSFLYFWDDPRWVAFNYMTFHSAYGAYDAVYPAFIILIGILIISMNIVPLLKKWR